MRQQRSDRVTRVGEIHPAEAQAEAAPLNQRPRRRRIMLNGCVVMCGAAIAGLALTAGDIIAFSHNPAYTPEIRQAMGEEDVALGGVSALLLMAGCIALEADRKITGQQEFFSPSADDLPTAPLLFASTEGQHVPHPQNTILYTLSPDQVALIPEG